MFQAGLPSITRGSKLHIQRQVFVRPALLDSGWTVMAHGDAREGKWSGNWQMDWIASTLRTTSNHGVSSITTANAHTSAVSVVDCRDDPADLDGLVRFAERRNLVSAHVPSHYNWSLPAASLARLAAGGSIGLTNTWRCVCSFELLMMEGKPVWNHLERLTEINRLWHLASCWL